MSKRSSSSHLESSNKRRKLDSHSSHSSHSSHRSHSSHSSHRSHSSYSSHSSHRSHDTKKDKSLSNDNPFQARERPWLKKEAEKKQKKLEKEKEEQELKKEKGVINTHFSKEDLVKKIKGYDDMTEKEKIQAKMKLTLQTISNKDKDKKVRILPPLKKKNNHTKNHKKNIPWERSNINRNAPIDDSVEEIQDETSLEIKLAREKLNFTSKNSNLHPSIFEETKVFSTVHNHEDAIFGTVKQSYPKVEVDIKKTQIKALRNRIEENQNKNFNQLVAQSESDSDSENENNNDEEEVINPKLQKKPSWLERIKKMNK